MAAAVELVPNVPRIRRTPAEAPPAARQREFPETTPEPSASWGDAANLLQTSDRHAQRAVEARPLTEIATERLNEHWIDPELGDGVPTGTAMVELIAFVGVLVLSADALVTLAAGQSLNAGHWFVVALLSVAAVVAVACVTRRAVLGIADRLHRDT